MVLNKYYPKMLCKCPPNNVCIYDMVNVIVSAQTWAPDDIISHNRHVKFECARRTSQPWRRTEAKPYNLRLPIYIMQLYI